MAAFTLWMKAIDEKKMLSFRYYAPKGENDRMVEPYYLVFRWSSWYLWGWCTERRDYRLFKLNRMEQMRVLDECFQGRDVPFPDLSNERIFPGGIKVKALFDQDVKWRLVEEFGPYCFEEQEDGKLSFHADYTDRNNVISLLLTFGNKVVLLEPEDIREELLKIAESMITIYQETDQSKKRRKTDGV